MTKFILPMTCLLSLVLLLPGCGSSPHTSHYLLTAENPATPEGHTPSLGIGPIVIPEYLSRSKMVYNTEGNEIHVARFESWAEPLDKGIKRVLALNLSGELNTDNIRFFPWHPKRKPDYGVEVTVLTLDTSQSQNQNRATLIAEWLVYRPADAQQVERRITRLQLPLETGRDLTTGDIAPAYSELLRQLSAVIAGAIAEAEAQPKVEAGEQPST